MDKHARVLADVESAPIRVSAEPEINVVQRERGAWGPTLREDKATGALAPTDVAVVCVVGIGRVIVEVPNGALDYLCCVLVGIGRCK